MAGYSETPLARKLGIKPGARLFVSNAPRHYRALLAPLPDGVVFQRRLSDTTDVAHVFASRRTDLSRTLRACRARLRADAVFWVSWPKRASGVATDVTESVIRELALPLGLVDVKVCAIDGVWSGLKLVIRRENR